MEQQTVSTEKWEAIPDQEYPTIHGIWSKTEFPTYVARTCFASDRNANLIAAAPEMLEVLQDIVNFKKEEESLVTRIEISEKIKKVINRALGIKE